MGGAPGGDTNLTPVTMFENGTKTDGVNINVDCGICHNTTSYTMSNRVYDSVLGKWDFNPAEPAASSDHRVWKLSQLSALDQAKICYRCHNTGFQQKRGTPLLDQTTLADLGGDHHLTNGRAGCLSCHPVVSENVRNDCTSCHNKINHKFPRGTKHVDVSANDAPNTAVACTNCHTYSTKHTDLDGTGPWTRSNHARIECQVCHVPALGVERPTVVYRRFREWVNLNNFFQITASNLGPFQTITVTDTEKNTTHTVTPYQWRWNDGTQDAQGQPVFTTRSNSNATLHAIKEMKTYQPPNETLVWGYWQVSHGIKPKTQAIRDCNLCHVTFKTQLGL